MDTYIISYDLIKPGKDYSTLHDHLKTYSNWAKPLESVWLIKSSLDMSGVRDAIKRYIDVNDKLIVIKVTKQASAWQNLSQELSSWIKNFL